VNDYLLMDLEIYKCWDVLFIDQRKH
jgi:hypothetical protein